MELIETTMLFEGKLGEHACSFPIPQSSCKLGGMNNTTTEQTTITIPEGITGYDEFDTYVAQQSTQGGRTHYFIVVPIQRVLSILPTPDPATPFEDNRQVNQSHASKFGDYVRMHTNWHSGPLTARTTNGVVTFDPFPGQGDGPIKFGALRIPRNRMNEFRIIDGQHACSVSAC